MNIEGKCRQVKKEKKEVNIIRYKKVKELGI